MLYRCIFLLVCTAVLGLPQKKPQPKPAEIELTEVSVHRDGGNVAIDGKLKNQGERPVKNLRVFIDFRDPDHNVISTRRGGIEERVLDPQAEAEFHAQVPDEVRAVDVQFRYEDGSGRDLKGINAGPFAIE